MYNYQAKVKNGKLVINYHGKELTVVNDGKPVGDEWISKATDGKNSYTVRFPECNPYGHDWYEIFDFQCCLVESEVR